MRDGLLNSCLLDYENITDICYECGSQEHKFNTCILNSNLCPSGLKMCR